MTAFSTISFPSSFQLRAGGALTDRRRTTAVIFLRGQGEGVRQVDRLLRLTPVAQDNRVIKCNGVKVRRSPGDSSRVVNSNSKSWRLDGFASWNWNGDENASDSQPLKDIFVAGLVFVAALSIGRRSRSGLDVLMQPLISQPEMSEASADLENVIEVGNDERKISTEHITTDPKRDASSSIESNEASESNYRGNDIDYTPPNVEAPDLASSEKFPNDVTGNDLSFASEDFSERRNFQDGNSLVGSSSEEKDAHFPSEKPERSSETETDQDSFSVHAGVENSSSEEKFDLGNAQEISAEALESFFGSLNTTKPESSAGTLVSDVAYTFSDENIGSFYSSNIETNSLFGPSNPGNVFTSAGIPAPTFVSAALPSVPEKVLVPAGVDEVQELALAELKVTQRGYARWLLSASSALSRSSVSVYPTTYNENGTELAFDNITAEVPIFSSIQGSAEAGLISRKPSRRDLQAYNDDTGSIYFSPGRDASLSIERNEASEINYGGNETDNKRTGVEAPDLSSSDKFPIDLTSNDMSFVSEDIFETMSSFGPSNLGNVFASAGVPAPTVVSGTLLAFPGKVASAAFQALKEFRVLSLAKFRLKPALLADLTDGAHRIVARAFEYTRLFQPDKPVTEAQAATEEASDFVGEDPPRIEAESMAENVVAAQNDLVAQVEEGVHATYEKLVEGARHELDMLRVQREEDNLALMKERAAIGSEILTKLTRNLEKELHTFFSNKVEKLRKDEDERKALSMTRSSAEEETKRARDPGKALDLGVARESCCSQCNKVMSQMKNINIHPHVNINLGTNGTYSFDGF